MDQNLFNNPMVDAARKALTPEQIEEYKRIGEYMYNSVDYKNSVASAQVRDSKEEDLILYASEALKSGGDPYDLSQPEIQALTNIYGKNWFERFGFTEDEVPKLKASVVNASEIFADAQDKAKKLNLSRQQRRAMERRMEKDRQKIEKK